VALVDSPSVPHSEVKPYSLDEARAFLKVVRGRRLEARWVIGIALGLRQGEVLGLRWEDVDFDNGTLRVVAQLQRDAETGHLARVDTKTARSRAPCRCPSRSVACCTSTGSGGTPSGWTPTLGRNRP
jgi:integrase